MAYLVNFPFFTLMSFLRGSTKTYLLWYKNKINIIFSVHHPAPISKCLPLLHTYTHLLHVILCCYIGCNSGISPLCLLILNLLYSIKIWYSFSKAVLKITLLMKVSYLWEHLLYVTGPPTEFRAIVRPKDPSEKWCQGRCLCKGSQATWNVTLRIWSQLTRPRILFKIIYLWT